MTDPVCSQRLIVSTRSAVPCFLARTLAGLPPSFSLYFSLSLSLFHRRDISCGQFSGFSRGPQITSNKPLYAREPFHILNPRLAEIFGRRALKGCRAIPERDRQESPSETPFRRYVLGIRSDNAILRQPRVIKLRRYQKAQERTSGKPTRGTARGRDGAKLSRVAVGEARRVRWMRSVCYAVGIKQCSSSRDAADAVSLLCCCRFREKRKRRSGCLRQIAQTDVYTCILGASTCT